MTANQSHTPRRPWPGVGHPGQEGACMLADAIGPNAGTNIFVGVYWTFQ
ncbi:hypothetical protein [Rhodococcus sp. BE178]